MQYLSNVHPEFATGTITLPTIPKFQFTSDAAKELREGRLTAADAVHLLEAMMTIRAFEEMIYELRSGGYKALSSYEYRGPTHLSIGMEASATGACAALQPTDYITSTHRGHGDGIAKGYFALIAMSDAQLRARVPDSKATTREHLLEDALEMHVLRTIAELFGKEAGYCRGRGGGMHIADFSVGHLGANAIVGGGVPIGTGAGFAARYLQNGNVVCSFAGDGAYANGAPLESLNMACMEQFTNPALTRTPFGIPVIFCIQNNLYGMTHRTQGEVMGVDFLARRAAGFKNDAMQAEVVNGMDVLAVREALQRAARECREGRGPILRELINYRYYGHSLSDPRNEYRTKEEEAAWKTVDPLTTFPAQLLAAKILSEAQLAALRDKVWQRNERAAVRAAASPDPDVKDVIKYVFNGTSEQDVPAAAAKAYTVGPVEKPKRDKQGMLNYRDALKEALIEEMARDNRVIFYGEDVADYGGAFKLSKGMLEMFSRNRVFNTSISETAICGTAVGAAMAGLRPVVELMYMDFALMASDQIANQAGKWHYMSGASTTVPLVIRASVGGGKGYGGQHSQSLESMFCHIPGMVVVYPATPYDAKGLLKAAIRSNDPVMFVESQLLYGVKGAVPEEEYLIPLGEADVKRAGTDATFVGWGPAIPEMLAAAEIMQREHGLGIEVVDIRTLVPLDLPTIVRSVQKTGKCLVCAQAINIGSYTADIAQRVQEQAFDYLDAPVLRLGAKDGIAPQALNLEEAFLPHTGDMVAMLRKLCSIA
jgi:2-oxoisovalerate dehydrogenase E1 component